MHIALHRNINNAAHSYPLNKNQIPLSNEWSSGSSGFRCGQTENYTNRLNCWTKHMLFQMLWFRITHPNCWCSYFSYTLCIDVHIHKKRCLHTHKHTKTYLFVISSSPYKEATNKNNKNTHSHMIQAFACLNRHASLIWLTEMWTVTQSN